MPVNPLNPHYAMENPASVFDEEAMTALELTGRTAHKVNQVVEEFNTLEVTTNQKLLNQTKLIDTRMGEQDATIDTAIKAQNGQIENLMNVTMPATVNHTFNKKVNDGTFDKMISDYAGDLDGRLDNLLGQVTVGTTTMDAEIIDARRGYDGTNHSIAGNAIREQIKDVFNYLSGDVDITKYGTFTRASVDIDGTLYGASYRVCNQHIMALPFGVGVTVDDGYRFAVHTYNSNGVWMNDSGWLTNSLYIPQNNHFRIVIARLTDNTSETLDIADMVSKVHFTGSVAEMGVLSVPQNLPEARKAVARDNIGAITENKALRLIAKNEHGTVFLDEYITLTRGTVDGGSVYGVQYRAVTKDPFTFSEMVIISANSGFRFAIHTYDENDKWLADSGWVTTTYKLKPNTYYRMVIGRVVDNTNEMCDLNEFLSGVSARVVTDADARDLANSVIVDYGREHDANYVFVRIPKTTINGKTVKPAVRLTSPDGTMSGVTRSALEYAVDNKCGFVIDAGLFDVANRVPIGQTIIDGVSIVNEPHPQGANNETISDGECYPLCIDANGNLSAPYDRNVDTATMIADGVVHATTGWVKIVEDYEIQHDEIAKEIVHPGPYAHQVIGQYQNGDYSILTSDVHGYENGIENTNGLTYTQLAEICVARGVKFAYLLDGGGSAQTVQGNRQLNPIYEGTKGRRIPSVIVFECE